ncbi:MAG: DMT family transporter [Desulfuromonadales bacterium]
MRLNTHQSSPRLGLLFVSLSAMLWGTVGIATQAVFHQSELNAVTVGFYRLAFAFPVVALLCWKIVGRKVFEVSRHHYLKMALIGAMLAIYQVFYFAAVGSIGVAFATLITLCTAPVIVSLASVIFLKEPLTRSTVKALFCALMGTALLVGFPEGNAEQDNLFLGVSLSLGSATGYALVAMLGRSIASECHPIHSTTVSFGVGAIFLFPMAAFNLFSVHYAMETLGLLLYIGFVPTAVAYTLFFLGMRTVKASTASILTMIEPLTATFLAWFIFGERLAVAGIAGAALLLLAIVLLYRCERPKSA